MRRTSWLIMMLVGALIISLSLTGMYLRYVKGLMLPGLLLTGVLLVVLAFRTYQRPEAEREPMPRAGLLLLVPLAVFVLFPSQNSGPFTASTPRLAVADASAGPLPEPVGGVSQMTMYLYSSHASFGDERLNGQQVALEGFVYTIKGQPHLVRLISSCCAADAQAVVIKLDSDPALPNYTWVQMTGSYLPPVTDGSTPLPQLAVDDFVQIDAPTDPYE